MTVLASHPCGCGEDEGPDGPGVPGRGRAGAALGPWAEPLLVSLSDLLCHVLASQT